ncbi:MAG: stage III sporulation protein AE [Firmicutes bacterium]|nr:stage III sporulation protein AE [Bacillota bacterium]
MKKIVFKFIIIFLMAVLIPQKVYAYYNVYSAEKVFESLGTEKTEIIESAKEIAENGVSFSSVAEEISDVFAGEIKEQTGILKSLAAISILCGFMGSIGEAFGRKEISDMGFFVCLIALISMVLSSVKLQCGYVYDTVEKISTDIKVAMPAVISAAVFSGKVSSPVMMPVMVGFTSFTVNFTKYIAIPFASGAAVLQCVNCISEREVLSSMCELINKIISLVLKGAAFMFVSVLSLQRLGTGNMSSAVFKTARSAIGAVPVVGDIMKTSVESLSAITSVMNNSIVAASVIFICISCAVPVIKIALMWLIYKLAASFMEPVTDKRVVKALDGAGDISSVLLSILFTVCLSYAACMFIILLSF